MYIVVQMASGEVDEWEDAADTVVDHGAMVVVGEIEGDEVSADIKTITVKDGQKSKTYEVHAVYAPGMWIKTEYNPAMAERLS